MDDTNPQDRARRARKAARKYVLELRESSQKHELHSQKLAEEYTETMMEILEEAEREGEERVSRSLEYSGTPVSTPFYWPHIRRRSKSRSKSTSPKSTLPGYSKVCVRCFRRWKTQIDTDGEIPDCEQPDGVRQKKCLYCSSRRSPCVMIPPERIETLMIYKKEMDRAVGTEDFSQLKQRFCTMYKEVAFELGKEPIEEETESRKRQRQQYTVRRQQGTKRMRKDTQQPQAELEGGEKEVGTEEKTGSGEDRQQDIYTTKG